MSRWWTKDVYVLQGDRREPDVIINVELADNSKETARSIAAALNAVEGIPTEALEAGIVQRMVAELKGAESLLRGRGDKWGALTSDAILTILAQLRGDTDA